MFPKKEGIILFLLNVLVSKLTTVNCAEFTYLGLRKSVLDNFEIQDPDHLILTTTTDSVFICMILCIDDTYCLSFSYNSGSQKCLFYDVVYGSEEKGIEASGTMHYDIGENGRCPMMEGYIHFRHTDGCYKPYSTQGSYSVATDTCANEGGHLIKLNDVTEKETIRTVFGASTGYKTAYWTGCYRDGPGSTWVWRDGTAVPLADMFRPGEPSGSGNCAYFSLNDPGFNDFPCADWPKILCEIDMV